MNQHLLQSIAIVAGLCMSISASLANDRLPNLIVILADDLGYGDLGCYGNKVHRTPHIDRLANEGARFTDYYVTSPVCTPTRMALLTGKHPARFRQFGVLWPPTQGGLPTAEVTLAEWLRELGYATGLAGKWHLGHSHPDVLPLEQGFESWYGMPYPNDMGPFHPQRKLIQGEWPPMPLYRDHRRVEAPVDPNVLTQQYHAEAVRFIAEHHQRPFFLFLSHAMPHTILGASSEFRGRSRNGLYGDAVEELDWSVGDIIRVLRAFDLTEQTLIVFTSDNGAVIGKNERRQDIPGRADTDHSRLLAGDSDYEDPTHPGWQIAGSNAPFRGGKGSTFEGGIRVPAIFWWPGRIRAGLTVNSPAIITDTIPTFAELAGLPPLKSAMDAVSIVPLLQGRQPQTPRTLFFGSGDVRAARRGQWKYLQTADPSWKQDFRFEPMLFDLRTDPGETSNLADRFPDFTRELQSAIETFQDSTIEPSSSSNVPVEADHRQRIPD